MVGISTLCPFVDLTLIFTKKFLFKKFSYTSIIYIISIVLVIWLYSFLSFSSMGLGYMIDTLRMKERKGLNQRELMNIYKRGGGGRDKMRKPLFFDSIEVIRQWKFVKAVKDQAVRQHLMIYTYTKTPSTTTHTMFIILDICIVWCLSFKYTNRCFMTFSFLHLSYIFIFIQEQYFCYHIENIRALIVFFVVFVIVSNAVTEFFHLI